MINTTTPACRSIPPAVLKLNSVEVDWKLYHQACSSVKLNYLVKVISFGKIVQRKRNTHIFEKAGTYLVAVLNRYSTLNVYLHLSGLWSLLKVQLYTV